METKSEWKGVGKGRQENACYFWDSGGCSSCCLQSNLPSYRHLTLIKGTCQTSRYLGTEYLFPVWLAPYVSYVLITTPLFTIRGALSFSPLTFPLFSLPALHSVFFKTPVSPWSSILELPLLSDCIYACVSPRSLLPISPFSIQW